MEKKSRFQRWIDYRVSKSFFVLGCCASVVLTVAIGFFEAGWVTHGRAKSMVEEASSNAKLDLATAVCVAQFLAQKDAAAQQQMVKRTAFWIRGQVIAKGGWSKLPGQTAAIPGVDTKCAQQLAEMPTISHDKMSENHPGAPQKTSLE